MLGVNHSLLSQGKIIGVVEIVPVPHGTLWPCCSGCLQVFWSSEPFKVVKWSLDRWILHLAHGNDFPKKVTPLRADKVSWNITKHKTKTIDTERKKQAAFDVVSQTSHTSGVPGHLVITLEKANEPPFEVAIFYYFFFQINPNCLVFSKLWETGISGGSNQSKLRVSVMIDQVYCSLLGP